MGRLFSRVLCGDISPPSILVALPECDRSLSQSEAENGPRAACERASQLTAGPRELGELAGRPQAACGPGGLRRANSQRVFLTFPRCLLRVVSSTRVDDCGGVQGFKTHPRLGSESSGRQSYGISLIKKLLISAKSQIFMIMSVCREIVKTRKISYLYVFSWKTIEMQ